MVHSRDLLTARLRGEPFDLVAAARQPLIVPSGMNSLRVLKELRRHPVPMAVVVDEYGSILGLVTTSDLLGAIAGELMDTEDMDEPLIVAEGDGSWLVDGSLPLEQLAELLQTKVASDGYFTLAGLVMHQIGDMPQPGDTFEWSGFQFEVVEIDGFRVEQVRVRPGSAKTAEPGFIQ